MSRPPREDPGGGYCAACGEPCRGVWEDHGIGLNEFWGYLGTDTHWVFVSECCGDEVLDQPPTLENEE